jgi:predicted nuclease with TOPRIM domain
MAEDNKARNALQQFIDSKNSEELKSAYNYYNELRHELEKLIAGSAGNEDKDNQIIELKGRISELEAENSKLREEIKQLKDNNSEIEKQKNQVKEQVDDYINELENIRRQYATISSKDK